MRIAIVGSGFIEARAPANVRVVTADMNDLELSRRFDRVMSVEMFEHMRNYDELLRRVRGWMRDDAGCSGTYSATAHTPTGYRGGDEWMVAHYVFAPKADA